MTKTNIKRNVIIALLLIVTLSLILGLYIKIMELENEKKVLKSRLITMIGVSNLFAKDLCSVKARELKKAWGTPDKEDSSQLIYMDMRLPNIGIKFNVDSGGHIVSVEEIPSVSGKVNRF